MAKLHYIAEAKHNLYTLAAQEVEDVFAEDLPKKSLILQSQIGMSGGGEGVSFFLNKNGHKLAYEKVTGSAPNILYIPGRNGQYS